MAGNTLLDLFINFDYNPLFFNDVIIYHNNNYSTFRNSRLNAIKAELS
jgi:hypothetical protein